MRINTEINKDIMCGNIKIYKIPSGSCNPPIAPIFESKNIITDEITEFFTGWLSGDPAYVVTHLYGQWGEVANYEEGGGPYFTPQHADKVSDLTTATIFTTDAKVPISYRYVGTKTGQSVYNKNIISHIGIITGNNGKIYVGAGLVCKIGSKELLLSHAAILGTLKEAQEDILVVWDWIFGI